MKRLIHIAVVALLLAGVGVVAWTVAGLPPVRMVGSYSFAYGPEPTGRTLTVGGVEFVEIGRGCFRMGSDRNAEGGDFLGRWCARLGLPWGDQPRPSIETPVHWVEFPRGFFIARTEITNAQHEAFEAGPGWSRISRGDHDPVVDVSWGDAKKYCVWLGEQSGLAVRLPSESEWECACRGGSRGEFCFGSDEKRLGTYAWFEDNSRGKPHAVGTRRANAWGLHDLHGNAGEWCGDTCHGSYEDAPADGSARTDSGVEKEPGKPFRIIRGGCWAHPAGYCRSASRNGRDPSDFDTSIGFRPAFSPLPRKE